MDALAHLKTEVPKAYECASYDDFKAGKCVDCGPNGEKCVLLGPRTIEHQVAGHELANGKRFFMATDDTAPYLSKHPSAVINGPYANIIHFRVSIFGQNQNGFQGSQPPR